MSIASGKGGRRLAGLDVLRTLAIVCVIGGHYFINTDFNRTPFLGADMFLLGILQTFTQIGVPLFLMLTGFLNLNKVKADAKYFKGIWRVVGAYLFFSVVTVLFRIHFLGEEKGIVKWVHDILAFNAIPYSWYIEMWIGLFLLTPFLNKLWHAIDSKRERLTLIGILFICTSLPDFTNRYGMSLLPAYWGDAAYPLLAFYCGAYIRTYRPMVRPLWLMGIIVGLCLLNPVTSMVVAHEKPMLHLLGSPRGIVTMPLAVCLVLLFYNSNLKSGTLKSVFGKVSVLSLDMYLAAWIFDQWFYPLWKQNVGDSQQELAPWYLGIVVSLVLGTFCAAWVKEELLRVMGVWRTRLTRLTRVT